MYKLNREFRRSAVPFGSKVGLEDIHEIDLGSLALLLDAKKRRSVSQNHQNYNLKKMQSKSYKVGLLPELLGGLLLAVGLKEAGHDGIEIGGSRHG